MFHADVDVFQINFNIAVVIWRVSSVIGFFEVAISKFGRCESATLAKRFVRHVRLHVSISEVAGSRRCGNFHFSKNYKILYDLRTAGGRNRHSSRSTTVLTQRYQVRKRRHSVLNFQPVKLVPPNGLFVVIVYGAPTTSQKTRFSRSRFKARFHFLDFPKPIP